MPEYTDSDPRLMENMRCIGEDITEILEYIPAGFYVRQIIRRKDAPAAVRARSSWAPFNCSANRCRKVILSPSTVWLLHDHTTKDELPSVTMSRITLLIRPVAVLLLTTTLLPGP